MARISLDPVRMRHAMANVSVAAQFAYLHLRLRDEIRACGVAMTGGLPRTQLGKDVHEQCMVELDAAGLIVYDPEWGEAFVVDWALDESVSPTQHRRLTSIRRHASALFSPKLKAAVLAQIAEIEAGELDPVRRRRIPDNVRAQVYARDGLSCVECGTKDDLTIDHIVAVINGGTNDPDNLQTMCQPCNSRKYTS